MKKKFGDQMKDDYRNFRDPVKQSFRNMRDNITDGVQDAFADKSKLSMSLDNRQVVHHNMPGFGCFERMHVGRCCLHASGNAGIDS